MPHRHFPFFSRFDSPFPQEIGVFSPLSRVPPSSFLAPTADSAATPPVKILVRCALHALMTLYLFRPTSASRLTSRARSRASYCRPPQIKRMISSPTREYNLSFPPRRCTHCIVLSISLFILRCFVDLCLHPEWKVGNFIVFLIPPTYVCRLPLAETESWRDLLRSRDGFRTFVQVLSPPWCR